MCIFSKTISDNSSTCEASSVTASVAAWTSAFDLGNCWLTMIMATQKISPWEKQQIHKKEYIFKKTVTAISFADQQFFV